MGEIAEFVARHYPNPEPIADLLDRFGLGAVWRRQVGGLSGGQKRRVALAIAFLGRPRLVVLDEPATGLDIDARGQLWDVIGEYHCGGGTVLFTSHYFEEIEAVAQRVVMLGSGRYSPTAA